jgi:hypothetical protein
MANIIDKIRGTAEKLSVTRMEIKKIELEAEEALFHLKKSKDQLQEALLTLLKENDLKGIKTSTGENYSRSTRKGISVKDYTLAHAWAMKQGLLTIDMKGSDARIKELGRIPDGFEEKETEFISIRKPKVEEEKTNNDNHDE